LRTRNLPAQRMAIDQPWIDLTQLGGRARPGRNALAGAFLAQLVPALRQFDRDGLSGFIQRYAALDAVSGHPVAVRAGTEVQHGVAQGIADDGALRVRLPAGERLFYAGEVSLRRVD